MSTDATRFMDMARKASRYGDMTVLITGETGTGKTRLARTIHAGSGRTELPLVEIDCAAIPQSIAESELFGHERGAFTGADRARIGKIRSADGGTVFLDEVGELDLPVQAKLLKILDDRIVVPMGSEKRHPVDVRIIAATNRDLRDMAERGTFRKDLLERLAQFKIRVPPLRERRNEIRGIATACAEAWNARYGEAKVLREDTLDALERYRWPGNVRELQNAVAFACAQSDRDEVESSHLPLRIRYALDEQDAAAGRVAEPSPGDTAGYGFSLKGYLREIERDFFAKALSMTGGNASKAAEILGMKGPCLRKALRERFAEGTGPSDGALPSGRGAEEPVGLEA